MAYSPMYGKYRATVTKVYDDRVVGERGVENRGRIKVKCPKVLGEYESNWCEPCFNFCYEEHGDFVLPKVGDTVWVEFEEGDANKPVWVGNWFSKDHTVIETARNKVNNPSAPPLKDYREHHDKVRIISFEDKYIVMHRDYLRIYMGEAKDTEFYTNGDECYLERRSGEMKFFSNDVVTYLRRKDSELIMVDDDTKLLKGGNTVTMTTKDTTFDTPQTFTVNAGTDINLIAAAHMQLTASMIDLNM